MRNKRKLLSCLGMLSALMAVKGQTIEGHVLDSLSGKPLEHVCIGTIDTPHGCITDESGKSFGGIRMGPDRFVTPATGTERDCWGKPGIDELLLYKP